MNVMLTGGNGFLGSHLSSYLRRKGFSVCTPIRHKRNEGNASDILVTDLLEITEGLIAERKIDVFIHCAGIAHKSHVDSSTYDKVNTELTRILAERASIAGVKRFIFFSSIGVNGLSSNSHFKADDVPSPYDSYTESKLNAEKLLKDLCQKTDMEVVIIRPPLIYGNGAPGNFSKLVKLAKIPIPKPFGSINNRRSFVSVDNLSDFTHLCMTHASATNETFLISDDSDLSTSEFLKKVSKALKKPSMIIPFPVTLMRLVARLFGKVDVVDKLTVNLSVNIDKNKKLLNWKPKVSVDEGLQRALQRK